jgi:hypothetical protein
MTDVKGDLMALRFCDRCGVLDELPRNHEYRGITNDGGAVTADGGFITAEVFARAARQMADPPTPEQAAAWEEMQDQSWTTTHLNEDCVTAGPAPAPVVVEGAVGAGTEV